MLRRLLIPVSMAAFAGCATTSLGSGEAEDKLVLTDASKRAITAVKVIPDPRGRRVTPLRVVCAEPSPDIAKAVSNAIEATLGAKVEKPSGTSAGLDASLNRSVTESIAQLGSRLATIQLLRDELADLCRAYANGAVSSITYTLRLSRLDKKMITLLVSEASAGALSRALVGIDGSTATSAAPTAEAIKQADGKVQEAATAVSDAGKTVTQQRDVLEKAKDDTSREAAKKSLQEAEALLQERMRGLHDRMAERLVLDARLGQVKATAATTNTGLPPPSIAGTLDLKSIHRAYLDDDDAGTLLDACLTSMEDNALETNKDVTGVAELQRKRDAKQVELTKAEGEIDLLLRRSLTLQQQQQQQQQQVDRTAYDRAVLAARTLKVEIDNLDRQAAALGGSVDRTALLRFCRNGMDQITSMIERKIRAKIENDYYRLQADVCKSALADSTSSQSTKDSPDQQESSAARSA